MTSNRHIFEHLSLLGLNSLNVRFTQTTIPYCFINPLLLLCFISLRYDHKETVKLSCLHLSERHYKSGKWLMDNLIFDSKLLFFRCQTLPDSFLFRQSVLWLCTLKLLLFSCRYKWRGWILFLKKKRKIILEKKKKTLAPRIKLNPKNVQWPLAEAEDSACISINSPTYLLFRKCKGGVLNIGRRTTFLKETCSSLHTPHWCY